MNIRRAPTGIRELTASLPVSLSSIFCLYASENGLVTSLSLPRPDRSKSKGKRQLS